MRRCTGFLPGTFAGFLFVLLTGLPHLGVTLADADFLAETLAPATLTRSLLTDDVLTAKPAWVAPAPSERVRAFRPGPAHEPPRARQRTVYEAHLPAPPWRRALRHCLSAQQSGCT